MKIGFHDYFALNQRIVLPTRRLCRQLLIIGAPFRAYSLMVLEQLVDSSFMITQLLRHVLKLIA